MISGLIFKAATQNYLDRCNDQARLKQTIKANHRACGVIITNTLKLYSPRRRQQYLNQIASRSAQRQARLL